MLDSFTITSTMSCLAYLCGVGGVTRNKLTPASWSGAPVVPAGGVCPGAPVLGWAVAGGAGVALGAGATVAGLGGFCPAGGITRFCPSAAEQHGTSSDATTLTR